MAEAHPSLIIRTKLRPPRLGADVVLRRSLIDRLEQARDLPVTMVSAPGGYGKTTLVAHWLTQSDRAFAWLTLDERDDVRAVFLEYLVAAVRTVIPEACPETLDAVRSASTGEIEPLTVLLLNELDSLPRDVVLVLDEFHWIRNPVVLEMMSALLRHPPAPLHLVLLARFDPPLPLARLRGLGLILDVREQDLRFTTDQASSFLAAGLPETERLDAAGCSRLVDTTHGWPVGLKLAKSRLRLGEELDFILQQLAAGTDSIHNYLTDEVLARLPEERRRQLLAMALLDSFSESLCEALLEGMRDDQEEASFVEWAQGRGLFVQPLDDDGRWFRFHPLFREVLAKELDRCFSEEEVVELHRRAGRWLEDHGVYEEALEHYEEARDSDAAISLVEAHRRELMGAEGWSRLQRWLDRLPEAARRSRPELLLALAWLQEDRLDYQGLKETIGKLEELIGSEESEYSESRSGELDVLRAVALYFEFDAAAMFVRTSRALEQLPEDLLHARGMALALHAWAHQMLGDLSTAERTVLTAVADERYRDTTVHGFGLAALGFIYWIEGDLSRLERTARELLRVAQGQGLGKSSGYARYQLGVAQLEGGSPDDAEATLGSLLRQRLPADLGNAFHGGFAVAFSLCDRGQKDQARDLVRSLAARALALSHGELLAQCEAFEAELALREGRVAETAAWVEKFEPSVVPLHNRLFWPELTYIKALILGESAAGLEEAGKLLEQLERHLSSIHHRRSLLDVAVLGALLRWKRGDRTDALQLLGAALEEAAPLGLRRPFTDVAPCLDELYSGLELEGATAEFVGSIRESRPVPEEARSAARLPAHLTGIAEGLVESLTDREIEVLERLAERLTDKEIAAELGIASKTVKRHNSNLFSKLGVHGRREAVKQARRLGLLPESARQRHA